VEEDCIIEKKKVLLSIINILTFYVYEHTNKYK